MEFPEHQGLGISEAPKVFNFHKIHFPHHSQPPRPGPPPLSRTTGPPFLFRRPNTHVSRCFNGAVRPMMISRRGLSNETHEINFHKINFPHHVCLFDPPPRLGPPSRAWSPPAAKKSIICLHFHDCQAHVAGMFQWCGQAP